MANMFYYLGDFASKPMSWGWMDGESRVIEWIAGINYNIYNWLMLKSVYFNDKGGCDVWRDYNEDLELDEEDDKFTPIIFTKNDKE